jgi:hypothetical protein
MQHPITAEAELSAIRLERRRQARYQSLLRQLCKDYVQDHRPADYAAIRSIAQCMNELEEAR